MSRKSLVVILWMLCFLNVSGQEALMVKDWEKSVVIVMRYDYAGNYTGHGSGFLSSSTGEITTNYHVVEGAYSLKVKFSDGVKSNVISVVRGSKMTDVAVIKVHAKGGLKALEISNVIPQKGEKCWSISTPVDTNFINTITEGIISNVHFESSPKLIQTTAMYTHGSSGGPLINENGDVIGIISGGLEGRDGVRANLNFAIWSGEIINSARINKPRITDPAKHMATVSFYVDHVNLAQDIKVYVDGVPRGFLNSRSSVVSQCNLRSSVSVELSIGSHSYYVIEGVSQRVWKGVLSVAESDRCVVKNLHNEPVEMQRRVAFDSKGRLNPKYFNILYKMTEGETILSICDKFSVTEESFRSLQKPRILKKIESGKTLGAMCRIPAQDMNIIVLQKLSENVLLTPYEKNGREGNYLWVMVMGKGLYDQQGLLCYYERTEGELYNAYLKFLKAYPDSYKVEFE